MFGIRLSWTEPPAGAAACGTQLPACPTANGQCCFVHRHSEGTWLPCSRQHAGAELVRKPFPWLCFIGRLCKGLDAVAKIHSDITMFSALNHRFP